MSYGYCGSLLTNVSANLKLDSRVKLSVAADVDLTIAPSSSATVTFSVIVPVNIGFNTITWSNIIDPAATLDYVGCISQGALVNLTTSTAGNQYYLNGSLSQTANPSSDSLFNTIVLAYELKNSTNVQFKCNKLVAGISYVKSNPTLPTLDMAKFDIYASVAIVV